MGLEYPYRIQWTDVEDRSHECTTDAERSVAIIVNALAEYSRIKLESIKVYNDDKEQEIPARLYFYS